VSGPLGLNQLPWSVARLDPVSNSCLFVGDSPVHWSTRAVSGPLRLIIPTFYKLPWSGVYLNPVTNSAPVCYRLPWSGVYLNPVTNSAPVCCRLPWSGVNLKSVTNSASVCCRLPWSVVHLDLVRQHWLTSLLVTLVTILWR